MGNFFSDIAAGALSGLLGSVGDTAIKVRQAIKGIELDPNKRAEIDAQLAQIDLQVEQIKQQARELEVKSQEITEKDRESARTRESEVLKAGGKNLAMLALAVIAVLGMGWLTYYVFHYDIREREISFMIVGFAIAIVKDIYGYYFGSSMSSAVKTETISQLVKK